MICQELDQFLYPYLDGEFDLAEQEDMERHLAGCAPCGARVSAEAQVQALIRERARAGSPGTAPLSLRTSITRQLHDDQRRAARVSWARWGSAALVAATTAGVMLHSRTPPTRRFDEDAALRHSRKLPYEVPAATPEQAAAWFDGKLGYRVPVPNLGHATVTGARLSNVREREAAYIGYEAGAVDGDRRRVSVFVMEDPAHELETAAWPSIQMEDIRGYRVASWRRDGMVYELVSDLPESQVRELIASGAAVGDSVPAPAVPPAPAAGGELLPASFHP